MQTVHVFCVQHGRPSYYSVLQQNESFPEQRVGKLLPLESGIAKLEGLTVALTPFIRNSPDRDAANPEYVYT